MDKTAGTVVELPVGNGSQIVKSTGESCVGSLLRGDVLALQFLAELEDELAQVCSHGVRGRLDP